ncbi:uncharacterized protein il17rb [Sphaeramia orbicularis]|uniref:SEFIR domain-containing protein n=1 Tax=Sphaeramia orbicularis TaxID=375764 RepID=A0A673AE85_9TELE|nr:interleukin-17 receptor B [Sphaeramia orbicularis]
MMWSFSLISLLCGAIVLVISHDIALDCHDFEGVLNRYNVSPSKLGDLRGHSVTLNGINMLNISWAVNIDATIKHLEATHIRFPGKDVLCKYIPPLGKANISETLKQVWFNYLTKAEIGHNLIQAANTPLPQYEGGPVYLRVNIRVFPKPFRAVKSTVAPTPPMTISTPVIPHRNNHRELLAIFGGLSGLMLLISCFFIYKNCFVSFTPALGYKGAATSPVVSVPVLMVYPAENSTFQSAVVALADFLQQHGSCSVAIDIWQQGNIAKLGPMRWLAGQVKAAERVLIVCPQPGLSPPTLDFPGPSIPAAAQDLYSLILNMVASNAKSSTELAKYWVVELGEQRDRKSGNLALELRSCKRFCLMKDLNKLFRSLHGQRQDKMETMSGVFFRPRITFDEKNAGTLRAAVQKLSGHQPRIVRETE